MRKICVVTGTRAEYGLLYWLMREIQSDAELQLQIIVTGMHLSPEFGLTWKIIEEDGFVITANVEMLLSSDTPVGIAKSLGLGVIGFADTLNQLKPDLLVLLGDRYEILSAAQAALISRIPVAHIHGGELTEGLIDEAIRHSITKMSHLHFVAAEPYRQRVIQLGENPERVLNFGAPGLDSITKLSLLDRSEFEESIDFKLGDLNFLVTFHPVTLSKSGPESTMYQLFEALDHFPEAKIIFTKPNSDTDGRIISILIDNYVAKHPDRMKSFVSLGHTKYLSALRHIDIVIGNSSSGLLEAPLFGKPTINIGSRQAGRLKASSVIDCDETSNAISNAIRQAQSNEFKLQLANIHSLYGSGNASFKIKQFIKYADIDTILMKKFYDIG